MSNWCPEIYRSIFVDRFNDDKIRIAPCCQAVSAIEAVDSFDFNTSPYLSGLRKQFDQGQKPKACNRCWQAEEMGHKSRRQSAIEFFNLTEPSTEVSLQGIDHNATWACNMACIMCNPNSSSLWAKEKSYGPSNLISIGRKFQKDNNILDKLDVSDIKKIHFNGGEPFLNLQQLDLLKQLDKHSVLKNVFISYNTNGSILPDRRIIEYWGKSRLVKLFFSIDATGPAFEYIRWPGKWLEVDDNIQRMKHTLPSNVMFGLNVTVGNYNILELRDLWQWFNTTIATNRDGDPSDFNWQIANNFDPRNCRAEAKSQMLQELKGIDQLQGLVDYVTTSQTRDESTGWIEILENYDQKRNTQWRKALKIAKYY